MANTPYANFVLESKLKDQLDTKVDLLSYCTIDRQLAEQPGMTKIVHTYMASGEVEELAQGSGNSSTGKIGVKYISREYTVKCAQEQFPYYDEQLMTDPNIVDKGIEYLSESMTNYIRAKAIAEFGHANLVQTTTDWSYDDFCDAMAQFGEEDQDLFILINPKQKAAIRKKLKDDLKQVEAFVRTGYIGHVNGAPITVSAKVPEGVAFIATKEAVTAFIKEDVTVEQDRDKDTRENVVIGRRYCVVALSNAKKVVMMGAAQTTTLTATADLSEGTVTGAADTGAKVYAYNAETGVCIGSATAANNAYSITADTEGWVAETTSVYVVSEVSGKVNSAKTVTVQA